MASIQQSIIGAKGSDSVYQVLEKLKAKLLNDYFTNSRKDFSKCINAAVSILKTYKPKHLDEKKDIESKWSTTNFIDIISMSCIIFQYSCLS